jgi:hypothetical protein
MNELPQRWFEKIWFEPNTGCWLWGGSVDAKGYGMVRFNGKNARAHRAVFTVMTGITPVEIDHLCRERSCVNPAHLENVSKLENIARRPKPTECPKGHPLRGFNVFLNSKGKRCCRVCARNNSRKQNAKRMATYQHSVSDSNRAVAGRINILKARAARQKTFVTDTELLNA